MLYRSIRTPSIWREMDRLQREMNRVFSGFAPSRVRTAPSYPAFNIWADEENALITAEIPGVSADDIQIDVVGETLTLSGNRTPDELPEGAQYHRRERGYGKFARRIQLPYLVDVDTVKAIFKNGVLNVSLSRAEADKPKKISIQTA